MQAPSYGPFLTYADSRDLRRELYMAYNTKCTHDNASNNLEIVKKLANVRMEIAQLLGYDNFAEYNLQERMAQNSESVYKLLDQLLEAYTPTAKQEYAEVQALARQAEGEDFVLMPWDWAYYSHKLKDRKFNIDDELLRPYFELNNVKEGVFGLATRLYGITFKRIRIFPFITRMWMPTKSSTKTGNSLPCSIPTSTPEQASAREPG